MPRVHFESPGARAALGEQGGLLVDDGPGDGQRRTEGRGGPDHLVAPDHLRRRLGTEAEEVDQPGSQASPPRLVSRLRLAVEASVTKAPVR